MSFVFCLFSGLWAASPAWAADPPAPTGDVTLSREDARSPAKYRAAKMQAEKNGGRVLIEGRNDAA